MTGRFPDIFSKTGWPGRRIASVPQWQPLKSPCFPSCLLSKLKKQVERKIVMVLIYEVQIFWDGHKIDEISIFILMLLFLSNVKMKFSSKFVAFSEYQNMNKSILKTIFKTYNILSDCHWIPLGLTKNLKLSKWNWNFSTYNESNQHWSVCRTLASSKR